MSTSICEFCSACQAWTSNSSVLRRPSANMLRVQVFSVYVVYLLFDIHWIELVNADCWYNNNKYEEGNEVATAEPCLNCTCNRGTLVCYLRVCSQLPNPPPQGCILLHRYRACCPELICEDTPLNGNRIEARSEPDDFVDVYDRSILENACLANGSIYGPGSAMDSSSLCEYCYCLGGQQRCVKPKCLLPIKGCIPLYSSSSCCPMHYNCSEMSLSTSTTTSSPSILQGSCIVSGKYYPEGGKVLGVGHSVCDNCYCIRGLVRCEPLSCAPPLLGCLPVVKPGECCAASYNCSGTIETRPVPHYGNFPIVSKEYAKLRKEVQKSTTRKGSAVTESSKDNPYYVIAESPAKSTTKTYRIPGNFGTTRHFTGSTFNTSTSGPYVDNSLHTINNIKTKTTRGYPEIIYKSTSSPKANATFSGVYYATTNYEFQNTNYRRPISTTNSPKNNDLVSSKTVNSISVGREKVPVYSTTETTITSNIHKRDDVIDFLLEGRLIRQVDNQNVTNKTDALESTNYITGSTTELETPSTTEFSTTSDEVHHTTEIYYNSINITESSTKPVEESTTDTTKTNAETIVTLSTILNALETTDPQNLDMPVNLKLELEDSYKLKHLLKGEQTHLNEILANETDVEKSELLTTEFLSTIDLTTTEGFASPVTVKTVINSTDCIEDVGLSYNHTRNTNETIESKTATSSTSKDDVTIVDLESKVKVSTVTLHSLENYKDGYFDYDFQPTLPPSLPNLRIIPFLPSDALDSKKKLTQKKSGYPHVDERVTDSNIFFTNLFSPPVETEGGFVPKEPTLLENFYENKYHTNGVELNAVTSISVPSLTSQPKTDENSCTSDGREIRHGDSVSSKNICMVCICYYGDIVCQEQQCPLPRPGCRKSTESEISMCCPHFTCEDDESPTLVLDRIDVTTNPREVITVAEGIIPFDPFRDVIRTEPAPNLQTLIGDMIPFFMRKTSEGSTPSSLNLTHVTHETNATEVFKKNQTAIGKENVAERTEDGDEYPIEKVLQLLFSDKLGDETTPPASNTTTDVAVSVVSKTSSVSRVTGTSEQNVKYNALSNKVETRENETENLVKSANDLNAGVVLLKLAGCNIYGRMYRVGRIISELSGPCLECKCTDIGVQCTPLC